MSATQPSAANLFDCRDAFAASLNAPAIDVFDRVGAGPVIALARRLGITTALSEARPMALGYERNSGFTWRPKISHSAIRKTTDATRTAPRWSPRSTA